MALGDDKQAEQALLNSISFFRRFRELSDNFPINDDSWAGIPKQVILRALRLRAPNAKVKNSGGLFTLQETVSGVSFHYNLFFKYGMIEHIFGAKLDDKILLSGPVAALRSRYDRDPIIKQPAYTSLADIFSILDIGLDIYQDYRAAILKHHGVVYSPESTLRIQNPPPASIIQIECDRYIIVTADNQREVFEKSHKIKIGGKVIRFTSAEFTNFTLLADDIGYENAETLLATLSHSGPPWFNSPDDLSYSYSRLGGLIILFSSGEIQQSVYQLVFEGAWEEQY